MEHMLVSVVTCQTVLLVQAMRKMSSASLYFALHMDGSKHERIVYMLDIFDILIPQPHMGVCHVTNGIA